MSPTTHTVGCVINDAPHHRRTASDALVIIVIMVLASVLTSRGIDTSAAVTLLGGAGTVAAGTLLALRGTGRRLGQLMLRLAHTLPA